MLTPEREQEIRNESWDYLGSVRAKMAVDDLLAEIDQLRADFNQALNHLESAIAKGKQASEERDSLDDKCAAQDLYISQLKSELAEHIKINEILLFGTQKLKEKLAVAVEALEKSISLTMLPHQITHDELIGCCNENVIQANEALAKIRGEG
jgi:regulator of replication initiation timing